jgi:hypothetical protein
MGGPTCRADVYTGRHPAEYWMIEPEIRRVEQGPSSAGFPTKRDLRFELSETRFEPAFLALEQADAVREL